MRNRLAKLVALAGTSLPRPSRPRAGRRDAAAAFTLIEVIIAVGAVALVGVALAAIFEMTGRTVTGGRRVAAFNAYAAMIENQMRADFNAMSRSGFIVIRNEYAKASPNGDPPDIPLTPDDATGGRPRRIDQIMFFAEGDFASAREPVLPEMTVRARAARIYYGHGTRLMPDAPNDAYTVPNVDDRNNLGSAPALGDTIPSDNPNRYAFDWTLLRHVTALSPPMTTERPLPADLPSGISEANAVDSDLQVALQPASSHIFRSPAKIFPDNPAPLAWEDVYNPNEYPRFRSGLIDIATTDLSEIRNIITTASIFPDDSDLDFFIPGQNTGQDEGANAGMDGRFRPFGDDPDIIRRTQAWMLDALPAPPTGSNVTRSGQRVRYEPAPTNLLEVLSDPGMDDLERSYRRADQLMLAASNFLPHCTEFIVEWSFGETFPSDPNAADYVAEVAGQHIWYGMPRWKGGPSLTDPPTDPADFGDFYARPYGSGDVYWGEVSGSAYNDFIQRTPYRTRAGGSAEFPVEPAIIHGPGAGQGGNDFNVAESAVTSYFGYIDPTFNPFNPVGGPGAQITDPGADDNLDGDPYNDPTDSATGAIPWAWPKLFRVTLTLADPSDPTYEQTFQFVFDVPAGQGQ